MGSSTPIAIEARMRPALGLGFHEAGRSACDTALPVAGAGVAADSLTQQASSLDTGVFMFETSEAHGNELHFFGVGLAGISGTARVFREIVLSANGSDTVAQVTYRHLFDVTLTTSSAQTGPAGSGGNDSQATDDKWCVPVITSDAGLSPAGTRVMQGTTAGAAGSVVLDPMGAGRIMVVTKKGSLDYLGVLGNKWNA